MFKQDEVLRDLSTKDLEEISSFHSKEKKFVDRIQLKTTKERILHICKDEPTHKNIDIIHSASININGVWFELIKSK